MAFTISPQTKAYLEALGKTALTVAIGAVAGVVDNAIQNPTGGLAGYISANPQSAAIAVIIQQLAHNVLSRLEAAGIAAQAADAPPTK